MATIIRVSGKLTDRTLPQLHPKTLFDTLDTLDRAYALRRLTGGYTGPLIGARRASDGATLDVGTTAAGLLDVAALESFAAGGTAYVHTLYDQSPNGKHITQPAAASQPRICAAGKVVRQAGQPAISFDGTDDHLFDARPALYAAGRATVAAVLSATPSAQSRWYAESTSAQNGQYALLQPDGGNDEKRPLPFPVVQNVIAWQGIQPANVPLFDGLPHQATSTDTGSSISQWIDGAVSLNHSYSRQSDYPQLNRFTLGGVLRSGSLASVPLTFSEAVFLRSAVTAATRAAVEADQRATYNL